MAHVERKRNAYRILVRKPEGKYHLLKLGVDGKIIGHYINRVTGVDLVYLDQVQAEWWAVGNTTVNHRVA